MIGEADPPKPASGRPGRRSIKSARVAVAPERVSAPPADGVSDAQGKFDLHGLLGQGGMGSVFIAQDRRLGRVVALKVLRSEYGRDADLLRRFALEAQVGAQLEHPNIVPLYSLERAQDGGQHVGLVIDRNDKADFWTGVRERRHQEGRNPQAEMITTAE